MAEISKNQSSRIDSIEFVRKHNNTLWMDILRIAWKHAPKETAEVFRRIQKNDKQINTISKEMCDEELS